MSKPANLLTRVLREPLILGELSLQDWNLLVPQARAALLLGYLHHLILRHHLEGRIPERVFQHTVSAFVISERQHESARLEANQLRRILGRINVPVILLKGGAYILAGLEVANGRLTSDLDILVPKDQIGKVEAELVKFGWFPTEHDEYYEQYFREWMHEIPPLQHEARGTVLDIHHTILPLTAKYKPDPQKILGSIRKLEAGVYGPSPQDMVIHSATHLFHEGEFEHGLRDLVDIHELLNHFSEHEPNFWDELAPRAIELDLVRPLYYGLRYAELILNTNVPSQVMVQVNSGQPNWLMSRVMDALFLRAFVPDHVSCNSSFTGSARFLLYVRSHYLRMPMYLLIPHLVKKAWRRKFDKPEPLLPVEGQNQ